MRDVLPNASFVGFTGTPIELADASTRAVFGDYISIYDIQRAVEDGATVPIYYESRLAKLALNEAECPKDDVTFFQGVQAVLARRAPEEARPEEELDHAVRQIISRAVAPEGVVDIFAAAGLQKPDISIASRRKPFARLLNSSIIVRNC